MTDKINIDEIPFRTSPFVPPDTVYLVSEDTFLEYDRVIQATINAYVRQLEDEIFDNLSVPLWMRLHRSHIWPEFDLFPRTTRIVRCIQRSIQRQKARIYRMRERVGEWILPYDPEDYDRW